jgi:hypothetical protein
MPAPSHSRYNHRERAIGFSRKKGWEGSIAGLDPMEKRKISCPWRKSISGNPACRHLRYPAPSRCGGEEILCPYWKLNPVFGFPDKNTIPQWSGIIIMHCCLCELILSTKCKHITLQMTLRSLVNTQGSKTTQINTKGEVMQAIKRICNAS